MIRRAGLLELLTVLVWVAVGFTLCLWLLNTCGCGGVVDDDWEETDAGIDSRPDGRDDSGGDALDVDADPGEAEGGEAEADADEGSVPDSDGAEGDLDASDGDASEANSDANDSETNYEVTWCYDGYASSGVAAFHTIHMRPGYTYRVDVCERHEAGNPWIWIDDAHPCDRSEYVDCPDGYAGALTCEVDEIRDITYYVRTDIGPYRICVTESGGPGVGE